MKKPQLKKILRGSDKLREAVGCAHEWIQESSMRMCKRCLDMRMVKP